MAEKITYPSIPENAMIDIQVSGSFYQTLLNLSLALGNSRPPDDYKEALKTLEGKEPADLYELNVQVVTSILFEVETRAKEQGKTILMQMDPDTGEKNPVSGN